MSHLEMIQVKNTFSLQKVVPIKLFAKTVRGVNAKSMCRNDSDFISHVRAIYRM